MGGRGDKSGGAKGGTGGGAMAGGVKNNAVYTGGAGAGGAGGVAIMQPQQTAQPVAANVDAYGFADSDTSTTYSQLTTSQYNKMKAQQDSHNNAQQMNAQDIYAQSFTDPYARPGSTASLYSQSQNMNWNMVNGWHMTQRQKQLANDLHGQMHNMGMNTTLTRYDHAAFVDTLLQKNGVNGTVNSMSINQLRSALVGMTYGENKFVSTSADDFAHAPASSKAVFASRQIKVTYKTAPNVQVMLPNQGGGGNLSEVVMDYSHTSNCKIVGVNYTGNKARRQGTQSYSLNQIEIVVEVSKQG